MPFYYTLPNGDVLCLKYDPDGRGVITISLRDPNYRVKDLRRNPHDGLTIEIVKEALHGK